MLLKLEELKKWTGEFEKEVTKEMLEGEKYDGFKLVESRTNRAITDELSLIDRFEKIGISQDELFKDPQLKPLGQLEKLAGGKKHSTNYRMDLLKNQRICGHRTIRR